MKDNIIYKARLHWILFFWPFLMISGLEWISFYYPPARIPALMLAIIAFTWCFIVLMTYQFSSLTIKKTQLILRSGFWIRQTVDIPINKIESIDIRQSIPGSLLQYGTIIITGTGGTRQLINYLKKPLTCRRYIEQLLQE